MEVDTIRLVEYMYLAPYRDRFITILEEMAKQQQLPKEDRDWIPCKNLVKSCLKDIRMHYGVSLVPYFDELVAYVGGYAHISIRNRLQAMLNGVTLSEDEL